MRLNNIVESTHVTIGVSVITATLAGWTIQEWAAALAVLSLTLKCIDQFARWRRYGVGGRPSDE